MVHAAQRRLRHVLRLAASLSFFFCLFLSDCFLQLRVIFVVAHCLLGPEAGLAVVVQGISDESLIEIATNEDYKDEA